MTTVQKRTVLLLMIVSTLIGVVIRLFDVIRSSRGLVSFHSMDILILSIIMVVASTGLLLVKPDSLTFRKQERSQ
ncbi:MAG: hypothetical protein ACQEUT_07700 [Bacillota bacterium]